LKTQKIKYYLHQDRKQVTTENKKDGTTILIIHRYVFNVATRSPLFILPKVRNWIF